MSPRYAQALYIHKYAVDVCLYLYCLNLILHDMKEIYLEKISHKISIRSDRRDWLLQTNNLLFAFIFSSDSIVFRFLDAV